MNKETLFWALVTLSALAALGYLLGQSDGQPLYNSADERHALANECIGGHGTQDDPLADHYHATLRISVLNEDMEVPANIGLNDGDCAMRPIHTHSEGGGLHLEFEEKNVEAPLEAFFDIWGMHMDSSGIDDYRVDADHEFLMFVTENEQRTQVDDFEKHIIKNGQTIELIYRAVE